MLEEGDKADKYEHLHRIRWKRMNDEVAYNRAKSDYGYCTGDSPKESFLIGAMRHNPERAAARRLFAIVDNDESRVQVEILEEHDNELDAWIGRNNYRATCSDAITGPSNWPSFMFERDLAHG